MAAGIIAAAITGAIGLIGTITSTKMQINAQEEAAAKRAAFSKHQAALARKEQERVKFKPQERAQAPQPGSVGMVSQAPRMQDTGHVQLSRSPRMTAAERIKQQLQARRI